MQHPNRDLAEPSLGQRRSYTDTHGGLPAVDATWVVEEWDGLTWQKIAIVVGKAARDRVYALGRQDDDG